MFLKLKKGKKKKNTKATDNFGTTLIELMVVVVILSLVILGLVSFFGGSTRSWIAGQSQLKAQREARMALDQIVKEIRMGNKVLNNSIAEIEISFPDELPTKENITSISFYRDTDGKIKRRVVNKGSEVNTTILIDNIPADGFVVKYLDSKGAPISQSDLGNASKISAINITLKVDVDNDGNPDITLVTEVNLRNFGM